LFESTKMSFGDHLEELRVALFRSVIFLMVGFCIGLLISRYVMTFMQSPLTRALENYYLDKAVDDLQTRYGEKEVTEELKSFVRTNRLVFDDVVVEAAEVERLAVALQRVRSQAAAGANTSDTQPPPAQATAADHAASDPADADKSATKTAAAEKPAIEKTAIEKTAAEKPVTEKNSDEPATAAETPQVGTVAAARQFIVDDEKIPMPSSNFVRSRIWKPVKMDVRSLNAQEAFMIWMKAGLLSGIVVASPFIFWQIWQFIAAGLYPHEKNYVYIYLPFSLILFLAGGSLAFFFVFDPVLDFLFSFNKKLNIDPDPRISEWLGFVLIMPLGFGISFQLPLVMLFINRLGLVSLEAYVAKWRIAVMAIVVLSAVLTPADPISIFLMAVPLVFLFFVGLGLCKWMPRGKNPFSELLAEEE
ncbi:MAG: twin-arginine translocase subunit TatC, partial [Planctomycetota bacterium]